MTEKKIEEENRKIRVANAEFERLDAAGKRVAIAKDVIRRLDADEIRAESGAWVRRDCSNNLIPEHETVGDEVELCEFLPNIENCSTCALGAIFYCTVMNADQFTVGELRNGIPEVYGPESRSRLNLGGSPPFLSYLTRFFDEKQLELIEIAFERGCGWHNEDDDFDEDQARASNMFWSEYEEDRRLRAIMDNIIRNDGTFNLHEED